MNSDRIKRKRIYALGIKPTPPEAMRVHGVGEWCRRTSGYRLDVERADEALQEWVMPQDGLPNAGDHRGRDAWMCISGVDTVGNSASCPRPSAAPSAATAVRFPRPRSRYSPTRCRTAGFGNVRQATEKRRKGAAAGTVCACRSGILAISGVEGFARLSPITSEPETRRIRRPSSPACLARSASPRSEPR